MSYPEPVGLHVRAVWYVGTDEVSSLPISAGQQTPSGLENPDAWGTYTRDDANHLQLVQDFGTRTEAEAHLAAMFAADERDCAHDGYGGAYCLKCGAHLGA